MELFRKIDLRSVVTGHYKTLVDDRTKKPSRQDFALFLGLPTLAAVLLFAFDIQLSDNAINVLTNAFAIITGLLLNLLVLLHSLAGPDARHPVKRAARELARQNYTNIAYAVLVSLLTLVPLIIAANYPGRTQLAPAPVGRVLAGLLAVWLSLHFSLTMGMVLKRMHVMLDDDFGSRSTPTAA
jgi:hypothetical protein